MRIAAERHDIARRQRPVHDVALRQIGKAPGAFAQRQRRQRVAADMDGAVGRQQPRQRAQQRGLAGAVRPDQRDQMPDGSDSEISFSTTRPASVTLRPAR